MSDMTITNAQYVFDEELNENMAVHCTIDGEEWSIPTVVGNRFYDEILRQVAAGTLTIQDAD